MESLSSYILLQLGAQKPHAGSSLTHPGVPELLLHSLQGIVELAVAEGGLAVSPGTSWDRNRGNEDST